MSTTYEDIKVFLNSFPCDDPFAIESIGITYADANYHHFRPKKMNVNVFEYVISGSGIVTTSTGTFYPNAGDSYLLYARDDQDYYSNPRDPWTKIWVNIVGTLPTSILNAYGFHNSSLFPNLDISDYLNQIHKIAYSDSNEIHDQCFVVFLKLCQYLRNVFKERNEISYIPQNMLDLKNYIDLHLNENISLNKCSDIAHLSISQTIRSFRNAYGMAPYEYLNQQRIETAKALLRNSQLPIQDIAMQLGFADQYYFSRYFKKKCGKSPKEYRYYR